MRTLEEGRATFSLIGGNGGSEEDGETGETTKGRITPRDVTLVVNKSKLAVNQYNSVVCFLGM